MVRIQFHPFSQSLSAWISQDEVLELKYVHFTLKKSLQKKIAQNLSVFVFKANKVILYHLIDQNEQRKLILLGNGQKVSFFIINIWLHGLKFFQNFYLAKSLMSSHNYNWSKQESSFFLRNCYNFAQGCRSKVASNSPQHVKDI